MDFTFNDDQLTFREAMSRFLMTEAAPEMLREIWETDVGRSPELRGKLAEQGLTALSVPEDCGGLGMDDVAWALMSQELGYYAIPDSLADTAYVSAGLIKALPAGSHDREALLGRIADGSVRIAVGHPVNPLVADAATADLLLLPHGDEVHLVPRALVDVTANPSIDRTIALGQALERGEVQRATGVFEQAAGKGVNVAQVLADLEGQQWAVGVTDVHRRAVVQVGGRDTLPVDVHAVEAAVVDRDPAAVIETQHQVCARDQRVGDAEVGAQIAADYDIVSRGERARGGVMANGERWQCGWSSHRRQLYPLPGTFLGTSRVSTACR